QESEQRHPIEMVGEVLIGQLQERPGQQQGDRGKARGEAEHQEDRADKFDAGPDQGGGRRRKAGNRMLVRIKEDSDCCCSPRRPPTARFGRWRLRIRRSAATGFMAARQWLFGLRPVRETEGGRYAWCSISCPTISRWIITGRCSIPNISSAAATRIWREPLRSSSRCKVRSTRMGATRISRPGVT